MSKEQNNTVVVEADERVFTLSRPFIFEEQEYTYLTLDFERILGEDLIRIDGFFTSDQKNSSVFVKALSLPYQLHVAAEAAKVPMEFFNKLPGKDVNKIALRAQGFLLF